MDRIGRRSLFRVSHWFSKRIQTLSRSPSQKLRITPINPVNKKRLTSLAFIVSSIWVGSVAESYTQQDAIYGWHQKHLPPFIVLELGLNHYGFQIFDENRKLQKIMDEFPLEHEVEGSVWKTSDLKWIAIRQSSEAAILLKVYCFQCLSPAAPTPSSSDLSSASLDWQYLGIGWGGFSQLLKDIESWRTAPNSTSSIANESPKGKPVFLDPREIRY